MVVVVPGHEREEVVECHPPARRVDAALLPLLADERAQGGQRLLAALAEGGQRLAGVVAQVLPLLGQTVGVGADHPGIGVHGQDLREPRAERLLGVAQVADDFLGRPVLAVGPPGERGVALPLDGRGQLLAGAGEALEALRGRLLRVLFHGRHQGRPSRARVSCSR